MVASEITSQNPESHTTVTALKECPVCHAQCFSDMDVCYGCLNTFRNENKEETVDHSLVQAQNSFERFEYPRHLSAAEIDRAIEQETRQAAQKDKVHSVDNADQIIGSAIEKSPEELRDVVLDQKERVAHPVRLSELLEIVISVRIAQDAKARCEQHSHTD